MWQIICDRCKKPIVGDVYKTTVEYPDDSPIAKLAGAFGGTNSCEEEYDLCGDCTDKLKRFITGETENHESKLQSGKDAGSADGGTAEDCDGLCQWRSAPAGSGTAEGGTGGGH